MRSASTTRHGAYRRRETFSAVNRCGNLVARQVEHGILLSVLIFTPSFLCERPTSDHGPAARGRVLCSGWSHGGRPRCARRTPTMRTQRTPTVARQTATMRTPQSQRAVARVFDIGSHNAFSWPAGCSACCGISRLPRVCIQHDACMSDMIFLLATPGSTAVT